MQTDTTRPRGARWGWFALGAAIAALVAFLLWPKPVSESPAPIDISLTVGGAAALVREPGVSAASHPAPERDMAVQVLELHADAGAPALAAQPNNAIDAGLRSTTSVVRLRYVDGGQAQYALELTPLPLRSNGTVVNYGELRGRVTWTGPSWLPPLPVGLDRGVCGQTQPDPSMSTEDGGLGGVLVRADGHGRRSFGRTPIDLEIGRCQLTPHVVALADSEARFRNHDPIEWELLAQRPGDAQPMVIHVPRYATETKVALPAAGLWHVTERTHPWMSVWLLVATDAYTAATAPDGTFDLPYMLPGAYRLTFQREPFDGAPEHTRTIDVLVVAGQATHVGASF